MSTTAILQAETARVKVLASGRPLGASVPSHVDLTMRLRFHTRTLLCLVTCICVAVGLYLLRGYWLLSNLERSGSKDAWHAVLAFNGIDVEHTHFRGKPLGVWRSNPSGNSVTWLVTKHKTLTAIARNGTIGDLGGVTCNGEPRAVWTGVTPDGKSGIILLSHKSNRDSDYYVMFVTFEGNCRARRLVKVDNPNFETQLGEFRGWPTVELLSSGGETRETFSFPESGLPLPTASRSQPLPWRVVF